MKGSLPRRARKTVLFDASVFQLRLDEAVQLECARWRDGCGLALTPPPGGHCPEPLHEAVRVHLAALLKAFCDAAQPAGGLPLNELLEPRDLPALVLRGDEIARAGEGTPKLMLKVRLGKPVDLRLALAALHFFRWMLQRPALGLVDIGGAESDRLHAVRQISRALLAARHDLPASVYEGLSRRTDETSAYAYVSEDMCVHYGQLRVLQDERGVWRLRMLRTSRYRPVRLHGFAARMSPSRTYEWHEWSHVLAARLWARIQNEDGRDVRTFEVPVVKRMDHRRALVIFEVDPQAPEGVMRSLIAPAAGEKGPRHELVWEEEMVFNAADRDILVSYHPVGSLRIEVDPALAREVSVVIGDSPSVQPGASSWVLGRALMPREVVAVRFRLKSMPAEAAFTLSASGEWFAERPQGQTTLQQRVAAAVASR